VEKVAIKLAEFVARNGSQFEEVTRQRNPGETPFKYAKTFASSVVVQAVAAASKLHILSGDAVTQQVPVFCQVSL